MLKDSLVSASAATSPNPYVFIVGCPRSGTTLLERIVDAHPWLAIIHEMWWILKWHRRRIGLTPEGLVRPELVARLLEYPKFRRKLGLGREELEGMLQPDASASYANFTTGIFDLYGRARGKRLVGDKTPEYVQNIRRLHELWPRARFVHLLRDGRDVYLSVINWRKADRAAARFPTWAEDPVSTTALWWKRHVRLGREAGDRLGPELYYEMRYESLIAQPVDECSRLCAFLGVPYEAAMLRFHEGRTRTDPGLDAKASWAPITAGLRDWRCQMSAEDIERFEAASGDLLDELGYPRGAPRPRPETQEHATRMHDLLTHAARGRKRVLPERW